MKVCNWCLSEFKPNVSYQIYCCSECRENATKEKVSEKYKLKRRHKLSKKIRYCSNDCGTLLSIYNDSVVCGKCSINQKEVNRMLRELKGLIEYEKFSE